MKIRIGSFLIIAIAVVVCVQSGMSQCAAIGPPPGYIVPREIKIEPSARRLFKTFYKRWYPGGPMQELIPERFFPIGWSRDGKFAYYTEPADEECGCYFAELVIMDLRNDKELYHFKNDPQNRLDKDGAPVEDDIRNLWKRNEKVFTEKLREHHIVQSYYYETLPPTFRVAGKSYTVSITKVRRGDSDDYVRIRKISLDLASRTLGKKSLYRASYTGEGVYSSPLDAAVIGVLKSPYENRVAVVMLNVNRGWEGPPHTVAIQIAGADLVKGFRKP